MELLGQIDLKELSFERSPRGSLTTGRGAEKPGEKIVPDLEDEKEALVGRQHLESFGPAKVPHLE